MVAKKSTIEPSVPKKRGTEQSKEGRQQRRNNLTAFVWYHVIGASGDSTEPGVARSCDLSREGIGFVAPRALPVGERVFIEIAIDGGNLSVVGRVMHCRALREGYFRVGIQFEIVPPNDRPTLAGILDK